jgi:hypothetical protein
MKIINNRPRVTRLELVTYRKLSKLWQLACFVHKSARVCIPMTVHTGLRARGKGLAQGLMRIVPTCL